MLFVVPTLALSLQSGGGVWLYIFFILMAIFCFDFIIILSKMVVNAVSDFINDQSRKRQAAIIGVCVVTVLLQLPMCTQGGLSVMALYHKYSADNIVFLIMFMEILAITYVYGVHRFFRDVEHMVGNNVWDVCKGILNFHRLRPYLAVCMLLLPLLSFIILLLHWTGYLARDNDSSRSIKGNIMAEIVGGQVMTMAVLCIAVPAILTVIKQEGPILDRIKKAYAPSELWKPSSEEDAEIYSNSLHWRDMCKEIKGYFSHWYTKDGSTTSRSKTTGFDSSFRFDFRRSSKKAQIRSLHSSTTV